MLRSIPLRLKLVTALVLPMLVVGGYLYFDITESVERRDVAAAQRLEVDAFQAVSDFSSAIGLEHLLVSARNSDATQLATARSATDAAYGALRSDESAVAVDRLQVIDGHYGSLLAIREQLGDDPTEARLRANIELRNGESRTGPYTTSLADLSQLPLDVLGSFDFDPAAIDDVATSSLVDDYLLIQRSRADIRREASNLLRVATLPGNLVDIEVTESVAASIAETDESLAVLAQLASIDVAGQVDSMLVAPEWARYSGYRNAVDAGRPGERIDIDEAEMRTAAAEVDNLLRAQSDSTITELEARAGDSVFEANRDVVVSGLIGLWLIIGVGIVLRFLYRAIKRPLEKLTEQADHVAHEELPSVIEQMRRGQIEEVPEIEEIPVETKDEIGKLVVAFNDMHRSAVDLAAGQAESRRVVADMFVNLGRRNQRLVGRLLNGLATLEQHEEDPDKLAALYDLDHTATRMRRNAESLLVLAGAGQARRWDEPVAIHDIARAAIGEVENYQRVHIDVQGEEQLDGHAVADVTHLLAELVENALTFSPPNSAVEISAGQTSAGYVVAVTDHGIGMLPDQIQESNDRITGAAGEEESPSEFLGHYVVGRLAARHGIRVELSEGPAGGVTARAWIPTQLLVDPSLLIPGVPDAATGAPMPAPAAMPAPQGTTPDAAPVPAPSAPAIDPMLAPLGGTGPTDHALPDESPTPLQPSTSSSDFLSSLEAAGVQRRTSKLDGETGPADDLGRATEGDGGDGGHGADTPAPAGIAASMAATTPVAPSPAVDTGSATLTAPVLPVVPAAAAPEPVLAPAAAESLAATAPVASPVVDPQSVGPVVEPSAPLPVAPPEPVVPVAQVPDETRGDTDADIDPEANSDSDTDESVSPATGSDISSLVQSVEASLAAASAAQPAAPRPADIAPVSASPSLADVGADPDNAGGAVLSSGPFEAPRRTPGANMPRTELIGSIAGSMGSFFDDGNAASTSDAAAPTAAESAPQAPLPVAPSTDGRAAAQATDQALAALRNATPAPAVPSTVDETAALTIDPDRVRSALSGFQAGIARADSEGDA